MLASPWNTHSFRKKVKVMNDNIMKRWAWQILEGLVYMHGHEPPIIHRCVVLNAKWRLFIVCRPHLRPTPHSSYTCIYS